MTALHAAACVPGNQTCFDTCSVLIEYGARVNEPDDHGVTALHFATARGHIPTVDLVLSKYPKDGKGPEVETENGETPSSLACRYGHLTVFKALNRHQYGDQQGSPVPPEYRQLMEIAFLNGRDDIVEYFLKQYGPEDLAPGGDIHLRSILFKKAPAGKTRSETNSEEFTRALFTEKPEIGVDIVGLVIKSWEFRHLLRKLLDYPKLKLSASEWSALVSKIKMSVIGLSKETMDLMDAFKPKE